MTLSNIEYYVLPRIWERGVAYYRQGAVESLEEEFPDEWNATVRGTEEYTVEITLEDDKIMDYFCDCPYDGDMCKHVVATLLAVRTRKKTEQAFYANGKEYEKKPLSSDDMDAVRTEINQMLAFVDGKELISFLQEYAVSFVEFRNALKQRFAIKPNVDRLDTIYCGKIEKCFIPPFGNSDGRYKKRYSYGIDLEEVSNKLSVYWEKVKFLMEQQSYGDVASIALQVLRSTGKHFEEDWRFTYDNDYFILTNDCCRAEEYLMALGKDKSVPQSLKNSILKSLEELCSFAAYKENYIYDMPDLKEAFEMEALPLPKVLERVEKELVKKNEAGADIEVLVMKKIDLLNRMNRSNEAEATTLRYLFLPSVRNMRVDDLIDDEKFEEALQVLDEGICKEKQDGRSFYVYDWMDKKLRIYQRIQDVSNVINTAKCLFIEKKGDLDCYRLLKQSVPAGEWGAFYNELITQTPFPPTYWSSSIEADIYVEEKDRVRLVNFLRRKSSLDILLNYSHYLKEDYPEDLLERFSSLIQEYADKSTGRSQYEYVAKALKALLKLKGGGEEVCLLVDVFRQAYKRRRAMMEILKDF